MATDPELLEAVEEQEEATAGNCGDEGNEDEWATLLAVVVVLVEFLFSCIISVQREAVLVD